MRTPRVDQALVISQSVMPAARACQPAVHCRSGQRLLGLALSA